MASSSGGKLYRDSLSDSDRKRYSDKISLCNGLDPYEVPDSHLTVSSKVFFSNFQGVVSKQETIRNHKSIRRRNYFR